MKNESTGIQQPMGSTLSRKSCVFVISGPSGAGKSTFVEKLLARHAQLTFSVSATTRSKRPNDVEGREYYFLSREEFLDRLKKGEFLEYAEVHDQLYGTLESEVRKALEQGKSVLLDVDVQGGIQIKRRMPEAVLIFILPPSLQELERRLRDRRTDDPAVIQKRLENAPKEIQKLVEYDYVVLNQEVESTSLDLDAIVRSEILRKERIANGAEKFVAQYLKDENPG